MNENSSEQDEQQKGIFYCPQPNDLTNRTMNYSVKLDPSLVLLTLDGKNVNNLMSIT